MARYIVHRSASCGAIIEGSNLVEAIESNFGLLAREAGIGNAAGYRLHDVQSTYNPNILGGRGGVEVSIDASGMPLCHNGDTGPRKLAHVWIEAEPSDLPQSPHQHEIR